MEERLKGAHVANETQLAKVQACRAACAQKSGFVFVTYGPLTDTSLQLYEQLQASEAFALQQTDRVRLLEAEQEKPRLKSKSPLSISKAAASTAYSSPTMAKSTRSEKSVPATATIKALQSGRIRLLEWVNVLDLQVCTFQN